jgi:hypothetical protein
MREFKENFDEIANWECTLRGATERLDNNSLKVNCKRLALYSHPITYEYHTSVFENITIYFLFRNVHYSVKQLSPYHLQENPIVPVVWLDEITLTDIAQVEKTSCKIDELGLTEYDLTEFQYVYPLPDIAHSFVLEWKIYAESFSIFIDL